MGYEVGVQKQILGLLALFRPHIHHVELHDLVTNTVRDREQWGDAHGRFQEVRRELLKIESGGDRIGTYHLTFLEACLKTVFNETHTNAPFDRISPYFVVPRALHLASELGISWTQIEEIV